MKIPTAVNGKNKIRDSKILSLYATDSWTYEEIAKRFGISATRVGKIIYNNLALLKFNREHEKIKRIVTLKRILVKKTDECPGKDKIDVMAALREEQEGSGSDPVGSADTRVIIIRETSTPAINNRMGDNGDPDQSGALSRSVSVLRV